MQHIEREEGAAATLRQLGALVRTLDLWDDPVNLMAYVVFVFQQLFGYSRKKATRLMRQVHEEGKAVVSDGTREKCEIDVARLHAYGLWATMEHPS